MFDGQGATTLLVPVGGVRVHGVVGQVDRVHDVQVGVQPRREVGRDLQGPLARGITGVPQHERGRAGRPGPHPDPPVTVTRHAQLSSGSRVMAPAGHSATQMPQPLQ